MSKSHWDTYYQDQKDIQPPSQFAAFIAAEYAKGSQIFDIGCGNGRDTLFFSQYATNIVGVDGSDSAVHAANNQAVRRSLPVRFIKAQIEDPAFPNSLKEHKLIGTPLILYSRFFIHAITDDQQNEFFKASNIVCENPGDIMALEFRTLRDRDLPKVTSAHFRRYVDPISIIDIGLKLGFTVDYFVEGFGYAKYKNDDAYVARIIFKRP